MGKIYVGQIGVQFVVDTQGTGPVVDWTAASSRKILMQIPSGTVKEFTGTLSGTKDLTYTTIDAADLPEAGVYRLQAEVIGTGYNARGETALFEVFEVFK